LRASICSASGATEPSVNSHISRQSATSAVFAGLAP
jgi:hypothetical protein